MLFGILLGWAVVISALANRNSRSKEENRANGKNSPTNTYLPHSTDYLKTKPYSYHPMPPIGRTDSPSLQLYNSIQTRLGSNVTNRPSILPLGLDLENLTSLNSNKKKDPFKLDLDLFSPHLHNTINNMNTISDSYNSLIEANRPILPSSRYSNPSWNGIPTDYTFPSPIRPSRSYTDDFWDRMGDLNTQPLRSHANENEIPNHNLDNNHLPDDNDTNSDYPFYFE